MVEENIENIRTINPAYQNPEIAKQIADKWKREELIKEGILNIKVIPYKETEDYKLQEKENLKQVLGLIYESNIEILKKYCSMREEYYKLVSLWIIGTYLHKSFECYPYLFINAMRGSGKTRTLKLITALSRDGKLLTSLREAVLFRLNPDTTLGIDEFESINSKDYQTIREILNASYKKGTSIERVKRIKTITGEDYTLDSFEPYKPIVMANIWGMEEVLGDRAITLILEKSSDQRINYEIEDFTTNPEILFMKRLFEAILVQLCSYFGEKGYVFEWNFYINSRYNYTTTYNTYNTLTALTTLEHHCVVPKELDYQTLNFFNKIHDTGINGRNLELFMPLFILSDFIGGNILDDILFIAVKLTSEKRKEEMTESRDVLLIDFISRSIFETNYIPIKEFTHNFREFIGDEEFDDKWITPKWIGRALKRLNLVLDKRRMKYGIEIRLDIKKAQEKVKMFK